MMDGPCTLCLVVRDWGVGIPPERRQHLFDRSYQAHGEGHLGGLGLGLYISRQIVDLHGGRIDVTFPADGGSRFVVQLPVGQTDSAADMASVKGRIAALANTTPQASHRA